ncbi:dapper homolog 2 [Nycticebus coucang]|uniref:dapper homolog 2 n=1 Tax=Nycticebus coucang TaxID=9470 RepID=UPI00234D7501|nr:dapper homolog 2 [Nycticebus coucang]
MWAPGGPAGPAGWDRRRVGARLRAALAGLHELQGLRATQQARVLGALAMQHPPGPAAPRGPRGHELRLEAALAALQEQLSRLRQQDAGLKTHLDQLDQQISQLQLDVGAPPGEALDSDSRPSSGFYELSDGGSCSLSTSCASVCSDCVSPSLVSLLPAAQPSKARPCMGDWRPRSADEISVPAWRPQATEDGNRPLGSAGDTDLPQGMFRPRPVSTGDLDRAQSADTGLQSASADPQTPSILSQGTDASPHALDPQYQRDLVSQGGREVYPYPSPLHAVALQSPLFALAKESPQGDGTPPLRKSLQGPENLCTIQTGLVLEAAPARAYINRLLSLRGHGTPPRSSVDEQSPLRQKVSPSPQEQGDQRMDNEDQLQKPVLDPGRGASGSFPQQQGPPPPVGAQQLVSKWPGHPSSLPEEEARPLNHCVLGETSLSIPLCSKPWQPPSDDSCGQGRVVSPSRRVDQSCPQASGAFPARKAPSTQLDTGPLKAKATKVKKRSSDRALRLGKQMPPAPERHLGVYSALWLPPEWAPYPWTQEMNGLRRSALAMEAPGRSCSESTLYPAPFLLPLLVAPRQGCGAAPALLPLGAVPVSRAARRRQRQWQSSVDISAKAHLAHCPEPSPGIPGPSAWRAGGPRAWGRPTQAHQDACTRSESDPSEHSVDCASPLHSTVAETSGDEASDHTVNCFGDRESSGSDSEGGVQSGGCSLALDHGVSRRGQRARLQVGPPAGSRPPLPPVPKLSRIKASRALKRRIRRFQPSSLKVITLV